MQDNALQLLGLNLLLSCKSQPSRAAFTRVPAVALVGAFGKYGLETRSWQPGLFCSTNSGLIQRRAGVAGCQHIALFLNKRLPLVGGNWCHEVSPCTTKDPTEAMAQPEASSKERLRNALVLTGAIPYLPGSLFSLFLVL